MLIAARRPVLRAGLARLLTWTEPGVEVVGEVGTAEQAWKPARPCGLMWRWSTGMPPWPSRRAAAAGLAGLLIAVPQLAVVGICAAGDDELVADAMRAGARGCVDVGATGPELAQAVVAAGRGQAILSDVVLGQLHRGMRADELGAADRA